MRTDLLRPVNVLTQWEYEVGDSTVHSPMMIEYDRLIRQGRSVGQIRWLASGGEWPVIDLMLVDQGSFRLFVRHEPLPEGALRVSNWHEHRVKTAIVHPREDVKTYDQPTEGQVFDIATFPLLLAIIPWDGLDGLELALGDYDTGDTDWITLINHGRTEWEDVSGDPHDVWHIEYIDFEPERSIHYYVTERAPYWIGMELREGDGTASTIVRMRGFQFRDPSMADIVDRMTGGGPRQ